jgi:hypothetical protein
MANLFVARISRSMIQFDLLRKAFKRAIMNASWRSRAGSTFGGNLFMQSMSVPCASQA